MTALSVTATNVKAGAGAVEGTGIAGATITAGQTIYEDATDGLLKLCDSDLSLAAAKCRGIALHGASANQPLRYQKSGTIQIGATTAKGTIYVVGDAPGAINPAADAANPDWVTILGVGDGVTGIDMLPGGPFASGHQIPA